MLWRNLFGVLYSFIIFPSGGFSKGFDSRVRTHNDELHKPLVIQEAKFARPAMKIYRSEKTFSHMLVFSIKETHLRSLSGVLRNNVDTANFSNCYVGSIQTRIVVKSISGHGLGVIVSLFWSHVG